MSRLLIFEGAGGVSLPSPILRLKFDEGAGDAIADSSGNGHDFTKSGGTWITGKSGSGNALSFNGSSDYASSDATINWGVDVITVCAWVKWDSFSNDDAALWELSSNFNNTDGAIWSSPNAGAGGGNWVGTIQDSTGSFDFREEYATRPAAATWVHVAIVYDNSTTTGDVKIYFDAVEQSTTISTNDKSSSGNIVTDVLYLFSRAGSSLFGAGDMDDLRIYAGELDAAQLTLVKDNPDA